MTNEIKNQQPDNSGSRCLDTEVSKHKIGCEGFSFYFTIGHYGGFRIRFDGPSLRFGLGWVSFAFVLYDIERAMGEIIKYFDKQKNDC